MVYAKFRYLTLFYFVFIAILSPNFAFAAPQSSPRILIIDSYHEGYTWSDEVISSISSTISQSYPTASFTIEHLDTKRFNSDSYIKALPQIYIEKFKNTTFDLVFVSDDNAIQFLEKTASKLFTDTPIIFSGYNDTKAPPIASDPRVTGVLECLGIQDTLMAAQRLVPDAKKLIIINDKTVTGRHNQIQLDALLPLLRENLDVEILHDQPLSQICKRLQRLDEKSIVYLANYFQDNKGNFYTAEKTTKTLVDASPAPIFTTYNFFFQNGVTGGIFASGYQQGQLAANYGLSILRGTLPQDLPIIEEINYKEIYSSTALHRFHIPFKRLSPQTILTDIQHRDTRNILSIHSYSLNDAWTENIRQGVKEVFDASPFNIRHMIEFMGTDFHNNLLYRDKMATLIENKYKDTHLDAILVSDLPAYTFVTANRERIFKGVPIIFCGLSQEEYADAQKIKDTRGVIKQYDFARTTALALKTFPDTKRVFFINDTNVTSQHFQRRNIHQLLHIPENILVEESKNLSMQKLLQRVAELPPQTIIFWSMFTKDVNNQRFTPQESFAMVSSATKRPIFSCRDDFFSKGILGGVITSGVEQGKLAAYKVLETFVDNTQPTNHLQVEVSPSFAQVDYRKAKDLGLTAKNFAQETHLFYYHPSLWELYHNAFLSIAAATCFLLFLVRFQHKKIKDHKKTNKILSYKAETDELTGLKTRTFLTPYLPKVIAHKTDNSAPFCLLYIDLDNLKNVNDKWGHNEGDKYIKATANKILLHIRSSDIACRVGGDEFIILLDGCTYRDGIKIGNNISQSVQNLPQEMNIEYPPAISFGLSILNRHKPQSAEELIQKADGRMYAQKRAKRAQSE